MKRLLTTLAALLFGAAGSGTAQEGTLTVRPHLGVFTPGLPLVAIADGYNPHVQLGGAPAVGLELEYQFRPLFAFYGGVTSVFTRLYHSGVMELRDVDAPHSSRATLLSPVAGLLVTPQVGTLAIQPTVRVGFGTKLYYFDLHDVNSPVADLTADIGFGFAAGSGPVRLLAEVRWMPSRFDARYLPIRTIGNQSQTQNDWAFQMGFRFRP
ncbi:MAG TPA: hypothetical protein VGW38_18560 [Chloroflexota bacterium]|nr:hypothetical protein [Chloroflexota bacterium]